VSLLSVVEAFVRAPIINQILTIAFVVSRWRRWNRVWTQVGEPLRARVLPITCVPKPYWGSASAYVVPRLLIRNVSI